MTSEDNIQKIETLANEVATREGVQIYDVEFASSHGSRVLRIYIEKEGGVGIDDCTNVSRGLNLLLDTEDPVPGGNYNLEVSSPGIERPLKKQWHFEKAIGQKIWLRTNRSFEDLGAQGAKYQIAKQVSERLVGADSDGIRLQLEGEDLLIPYAAIEQAQLLHEFEVGKNIKKEIKKKK